MRVLITAGNTLAMIDRVRAITNIFTGKTGAGIAEEAARRGHTVTVLTSHPNTVAAHPGVTVHPYSTFEDLDAALHAQVFGGAFDAIVHCAAVSDYHCAGVYAADAGYDQQTRPPLTDVRSGKVKSHHAELWLRLTPTPKLVDKIRRDWHYSGLLVKFKLEVGVSDSELSAIAERSRLQSQADLMVANTLDGAGKWALLGAAEYERIPRAELASRLVDALEALAPRT